MKMTNSYPLSCLQVLAWSLVTAVSRRQLPGREEASLGQVTPRHTWTGHALPVTGIHVGHGPAHSARVVSASLDMTVKIYSMTTGRQLLLCPSTIFYFYCFLFDDGCLSR